MRFYTYPQGLFQRRKHFLQVLITCLAVAVFSSCSTPKNAYYFKTIPNDTSINSTVNKLGEAKIVTNDQLGIVISSLNPIEDQVFNAAAMALSSAGSGSGSGSGYQVDADGNIQLHRLGALHVDGLTRRELKNKIETDLKAWLKDPVVTVRFLNRRVTILGEVSKPQVINMPEEKLSLLEVLGSSGDVSPLARKDNILIIRETETGKEFKRINLEDHSLFTSEWYYLQPNDVLYIEPSDEKIKQAKRAQNQQNIGLVLSGLSVIVIVLNSVLK